MAALREIPDAINEYAAKSSMLCSIKPFESIQAVWRWTSFDFSG
jgi:hypothetical protein